MVGEIVVKRTIFWS